MHVPIFSMVKLGMCLICKRGTAMAKKNELRASMENTEKDNIIYKCLLTLEIYQ